MTRLFTKEQVIVCLGENALKDADGAEVNPKDKKQETHSKHLNNLYR